MSKLIKELSVFLPTYNEEGNIEKVTLDTKKVLEKVADKWEIIIINDGSIDRTNEISEKLASGDKRIRVVTHTPNRGYGGALKTGFNEARYEWVAFMDSDAQFDFSEINKFIEKKDEADLILGYRKKRADSLARKIFTFGWSLLAKVILGLKAKDYSCGFKMIKKNVYKDILPLVGEEKVTQIEMLVKARKKGFRFAEVGVSHYPRTSGTQTGAKVKVVIKSILDVFKLWANFHNVTRKEIWTLFLILGVGAFLRLYRIGEYMTFLGDESRDMIIVRRLLVELHPPLIGPGTSIGNMYLGPLYYYMMAIPTLIGSFSPVGPAIMVAVLGILTIALVWWVGKEWFGKTAGLIAAGMYAISPTIIIFSKSSWNPNIMPFFALLCIYSIWKVWQKDEFNWLIVLGISYAFVLQSHYLGLLLLPVLGLYWLLTYLRVKKENTFKIFMKKSVIGASLFLILMSPLLIFDLRHNFQNFNSMRKFSLESGGSFGGPVKGFTNFIPTFNKSVVRIVGGRNEKAGIIVTTILIIGAVLLLKMKKINPILASWILMGIFGLAMYKSEVFDHYMGFLFPALFLLLGLIVSKLPRYLILITVALLIFVNLLDNPIKYPPNRQMQRSIEVAKSINERAKGERFNLATLSENNNRDVYQYFLLLWGAKIVDTDPNSVFYTVTDQLFVVCEKEEQKCDPTHDPTAWITNFGWSTITDHWQVSGINVYKLGHAK